MKCKLRGAYVAMQSNFSSNHTYHNVPSSTTITYEGIFNSSYFKLDSREDKKAVNLEISLASVKNPLSNKNEVWLGTLFKSKYDGKKINQLIDLSIAIDVSGSMHGERIDMAKKSLIQLIQKLNDEDNIAISKFNTESEPIFKYQKISDLKKVNYITEIENLKADGCTDIFKAFQGAYNLMTKEIGNNRNSIRRIIVITDMQDNVGEDFAKFCENISNEDIYITILGISDSFQTNLAEKIANVKGANYIIIKENKDINKYLVEEFDCLCFPNAKNLILEITTPYLKIERIVGSGKEGIKEFYEKNEWDLGQHKFYSDDFKQKIFFLLLYFKRKNKILPKPVILILSEFLVPGVKKEISKIHTCFPSPLKQLGENEIFIEGGMLLLRLDINSIRNENIMKFEIKYENPLENKKENVDIEYSFKKDLIKNENYFSDSKIETALALFYFAKFNRRFMKICNNENKKKKYDKTYVNGEEFKKDEEKIKKYVEVHLTQEKNNKLNEQKINEYLEKMEQNIDKAIKYCKY